MKMVPRQIRLLSLGSAQLLLSLLVALFMVGPIIAVIPISFSAGSFLSYPLPGFSLQWYDRVLQYEPWMHALMNSLLIGGASALLATVLGTMAALGFARNNLIAQQFLMALVISPMIVPLVVSGVAMYFFLAKIGLVASFAGMILAHTILAIPFVIIPVIATLRGFDANLVRAANGLGATPWKAFFHVTLPNIAPGVISGALFAFSTSFDEVVVALFVSGPAQKTLPRQMFDGIRDNIEPSILAMSGILVIVSILMLATTAWLSRRR